MNLKPLSYCKPAKREHWVELLNNFPANLAVTLCFGPQFRAKVLPCYREKNGKQTLIHLGTEPSRKSTTLPRSVPNTVGMMHSTVRHFRNRIEKEMLGSRYRWKSSGIRTQYLGTIESYETNAHVHLKWYVHEDYVDRFSEIAADIWPQLCPRGNIDIALLRDEGEAWATYITKTLMDYEWYGDADRIIYSPIEQ